MSHCERGDRLGRGEGERERECVCLSCVFKFSHCRQTTAATRTTFNCRCPLYSFSLSPPLLFSLSCSACFSLSFSLLATRNRIKFAPWEFQLLFFKKNQRQLPPDPPAHASYHKFMKYASEKNIDLSLSLSLSVALELVSCNPLSQLSTAFYLPPPPLPMPCPASYYI